MHYVAHLAPSPPHLLSPDWSPPPSSSPMHTVPADVLFEIAHYLSVSDTLHLSLSSCKIYNQVIPAIYGTVELCGPAQAEPTLRMLARAPQVARHVQRLVVRPEQQTRASHKVWDLAGPISRIIIDAAPRLDGLRAFEWDGEDMLPDDRMWASLRMHCLHLQHISTTFGCFLPGPQSNLFKFRDLTGFALTFKDGFYGHQLHIASRESEPVFNRLWDMLSERCPNLETLSLTGTSPEAFDASRMCTLRWPRLRSISLGDIVFGPVVPPQGPSSEAFLAFLECHPTLESLHLFGRPNIAPLDFSALSAEALPLLKDFSGTPEHLRSLLERGAVGNANPHNAVLPASPGMTHSVMSSSLRRLCFPEPMHLRELTPLAISRLLMDLQVLTSLTITFALQSGYDSNSVFRTIVAACPQLLHLDLTCSCRPSFYLESFSRSLRNLSRLQTLALTIVKFPGEEAMHLGAARIALANPRLTSFTIAYLPSHAAARPPPPPFERGIFELLCDAHGIPVGLRVAEWRATFWGAGALGDVVGLGAGWRAGAHGWVRRWVCELRPSGHPDVPPRGWGELLFERGPAGEEARLLAFCMSLLVLAVWGVVGKGPGRGLFSGPQAAV